MTGKMTRSEALTLLAGAAHVDCLNAEIDRMVGAEDAR